MNYLKLSYLRNFEYIIYFIIFLIVFLYYLLGGFIRLGILDDLALYSMLISENIYGTLILSYPLSYILNNLYHFFPHVQWYSLLLTSVILLNMYFISVYIQNLKSNTYKILFFLFMLIVLIYTWTHVTITILTLLTMFSGFILIKKNILLSLMLFFIATLLRINLAISFVPFLMVGYLIIHYKDKVDYRYSYTLIMIGFLIILNILSPKLDKQYSEWLIYNNARGALYDLGGVAKKDILTDNQISLIRHFWVQDNDLLPVKKIIEAAPSLRDVSINKIKDSNYNTLLNHRYNLFIIFLILSTILLILVNYKNKKSLLYLLFLFGFILLINTRDVDRVTIMLLVIWATIIFIDINKFKFISIPFLIVLISLSSYYLYPKYAYSYNPQEIDNLKKEAISLVKQSNKSITPSMTFPTSWKNVYKIFLHNQLFQEKEWVPFDDKHFLPIGWMSRLDFFYKTHHIDNEHYKNYYSFLINDNTAFIGENKIVTGKFYNLLLKMYDEKYLKDKPNCKHMIKITNHSKHFSISQMKVVCSE